MDLYVRDVDPVVMRKLDELSGKKKVSRSEYVRQMLRAAAVLDEVNRAGDRYDQLVQSLIGVVVKNNEMLERLEDALLYKEDA